MRLVSYPKVPAGQDRLGTGLVAALQVQVNRMFTDRASLQLVFCVFLLKIKLQAVVCVLVLAAPNPAFSAVTHVSS